MASSVSGVNSNAASSIYGNRNIMSGLASGMDTESMIENAVSGIKKRISGLNQKRTTWEWKQESYRSIIDKMAKFNQKYISFNSGTNLFSSSFFSNSVTTSSNGANASKVTASGKTSSDIIINSIKQLASAARYTTGSDALGIPTGGSTPAVATGNEALDLGKIIDVSKMSGSMTLTYGTKKVELDFSELEIFDASKPEEFADAINRKLANEKIVLNDGKAVPAALLISAKVADGKVVFSDSAGLGNSVFISGASGDLKTTLGLDALSGEDVNSIDLTGLTLSEKKTNGEYLTGKTMTITMDGKTKTITMPAYNPTGDAAADTNKFVDGINKELKNAFGSSASGDRLTASLTADGKLKFTGERGSTIQVTSKVNSVLGLGDNGAVSYLDVGKSLGELDKAGGGKIFKDLTEIELEIVGTVTVSDKDGKFYDEAGNAIGKDASGAYTRIGKDGEKLVGYKMEINGETIGTYTRDTAMDKVLSDINNNSKAGVSVTYSRTTSQFAFSAKETGSANGIEIKGGLAANIFCQVNTGTADSPVYTVGEADVSGKDAIFSMKVNGVEYDDVTRSDNSFDVDGLKITLQGEFAAGTEAVTFTTKTDSDKIVTAIKDMVKDYNELMAELKGAFGTVPAQRSNGSKYEPLTDEDRATMSDTAIKAYEDKAKEGILFADSDLSSAYNKLRSVFTTNGVDGGLMRSFGLDATYSAREGTVLTLDEKKLRSALETNLDGVKDLFTKTKENGAETNGLMSGLKTQLDNYARTTGEPKGLLIQIAGSPHSPTSMLKSTIMTAMNNIDKEVERWEGKLSNQVDLYTRKFSQLEQLVAQMNSQSSSLMSLMGGTG